MKNSNEETKMRSPLQDAYSKKSYIFLSINVFCFIIIFFVLDESTGGSFLMRVFSFLFCTIIGGLFGIYWSRKREGGTEYWYKIGAGTLLMMFTLIAWSNNTIDCSSNKSEYNDGYTHGKIISYADDASSTSCQKYVDMMSQQGIQLNATKCFCAGYYDGRSKSNNKYK